MKLETCMATRNPNVAGHKPGDVCTEYQLHKSQIASINKRNLFDFTDFRLRKYIEKIKDDNKKIILNKILLDYRKGLIAIAWKSGEPIWLGITKESGR